MGFVFPWPVRPVPGAPTIRVMSYNVNSETGEMPRSSQEIDLFSPDVVFLVEHGSERDRDAAAGAVSDGAGRGAVRGGQRFPVTSSFDPDKLQYAGRLRSPRWIEQVIETPLGPIAFFGCTRFPARQGLNALRGKGTPARDPSGQGFSEDSEDVVPGNSGLAGPAGRRLRMAAATQKLPVLIAGDTNLPD